MNMRTAVLAWLWLLGVGLASEAFAQTAGLPAVPRDARIRYVAYDPDAVIGLTGHLGYQMMIEFGEGERIETVSVGDSVAWQITPNRAANLLFIKPVESSPGTNMEVVTNLRRYCFDLVALAPGRARGPIIYDLRFRFPPAPPPPSPPAAPASAALGDMSALNFDYSISGARALAPTRIFDDGRFTYFQFAPGADAPAIFAISADGGEELVNQQVRDHYTVIDRIAADFVLRYGREQTRVHTDHLPQPHLQNAARAGTHP